MDQVYGGDLSRCGRIGGMPPEKVIVFGLCHQGGDDERVVFDGIEMIIQGVKVRADDKSTEVSLPTYRAPDGSWRAAIILPDEIKDAISDTVIAAGLEAGILRVKKESVGDRCRDATEAKADQE
ncbi:protein of unknown function [Magnetospirillum sp. XM-1]|uniref:hypothetical protein n=1 Tax=Magnetospirillum sp. XM-1 TaxID=1663591 RepID=UPI00073DEA88|nr:hypothetical protein [Magnetospirillum sp. XM-1]CUW39905.1 protein of unknown function [Magnetospirillum sp. XM-1]